MRECPPPWKSAQLSDIIPDVPLYIGPIRKHAAVSLPSLAVDWKDTPMEGEGGAQPTQATPAPPAPPPCGPVDASDWNAFRGSPPAHTPTHPIRRPSLPVDPSLEREYCSLAEDYPQSYPKSPSRPPPRTRPVQAPPPPPSSTSRRPAPSPSPRNWSTWSLDGPEGMDTPFYTPPDGHCKPGRPSSPAEGAGPGPAMPVERWAENVTRYYNSQHAPDLDRASPSPELSELESLYQASLLAPCPPRPQHSSPHPQHPLAAGKPGTPPPPHLALLFSIRETPAVQVSRSFILDDF